LAKSRDFASLIVKSIDETLRAWLVRTLVPDRRALPAKTAP
jgi:hypothetical protein